MEIISSKQNPKIKNLIHLQKNAERKKQEVLLIEGIREIEKAVIAGYSFSQVFFNENIISLKELEQIFINAKVEEYYSVGTNIFNKIAVRESTGGIVAVAYEKKHLLQHLQKKDKPLYLVIDGVEKPGNIGAIFRTADAAGIDGIIITNQAADLYNPNAIRSSLGCVFTVPSAIVTADETIKWCKINKISIYCSALKASVPYHIIDYTKAAAIVMGTEATGLADHWLSNASANIIIPMAGIADSLNVSTASAILLFEAKRQRGF